MLSDWSSFPRYETTNAEDQYREVDEGLKRGGRAVHPVAQPAEAFEPAERALDHVALSLECSVFGVQLTRRLLRRDAAPRWDERPESVLVHELPEAEAVVALIG